MKINNDSEAGLYHRHHQIPLTDLSLGRDGNPWRVVRPTLMTLNTSNSTYSSVMPTMEADRQLSRISSVTCRGHSEIMRGDTTCQWICFSRRCVGSLVCTDFVCDLNYLPKVHLKYFFPCTKHASHVRACILHLKRLCK